VNHHIGTGKSYVLGKVIEELTKRGKKFQVTSTSGRTAVLLGGLTIHRFLRITPACQSLEDYIKEFRTKRTAQIFKNLDILIIDEIGMITNDFFNLISDIFDFERETGLPFGGIQIVMAGDLLQLGPIQAKHSSDKEQVFDLDNWKALDLQIHSFQKVVRQSDEAFIGVLNKIRMGEVEDEDVQTMIQQASHAEPDPRFKYIELYSRNVDKNFANANYLDTVDGISRTFTAYDKILEDGSLKDIESIGEKQLELKRGVIVMLLRNLGPPHESLTNGNLFPAQ
jgi:ATP-dependent DNA helicase PIF1